MFRIVRAMHTADKLAELEVRFERKADVEFDDYMLSASGVP